jgi:hypothetical protein
LLSHLQCCNERRSKSKKEDQRAVEMKKKPKAKTFQEKNNLKEDSSSVNQRAVITRFTGNNNKIIK